MEVTFEDADLAATCNSRERMTQKWGPDGFDRLGRRLVELAAAANLDHIAALPGVAVSIAREEAVTIIFDRDRIVISALLLHDSEATNPIALRSWRLHIVEIGIQLPVGRRG